MSDLNDFFAKKDRKKKRAAARSAQAAAAQSNRPVSGSGSGSIDTSATKNTLSTPVPKQPDDGWIEIEDPRGSQVNTGGRTVVEFRRYASCIALQFPNARG